jgi:hypothetical protein
MAHVTDKSSDIHPNNIIDDIIAIDVDRCLTDDEGMQVRTAMETLSFIDRLNAWGRMTSRTLGKIKLYRSIHEWCTDAVLAAFCIKRGDVGVRPVIPPGLSVIRDGVKVVMGSPDGT